MSEPPTTHTTFAVERTYPASPTRVFAAWANADEKARWMGCHGDWQTLESAMDFRVGGREVNRTLPPGGPVHVMEAWYHDIVPDQRIIYSYQMSVGDTRISVSLATIEFHAAEGGTRLMFTEQGAFLDGSADPAARQVGTGTGLDRLGVMLQGELAAV
jgi:uncharacterized protein YndB with AHSA1/START domain